MTSGRAEHGVIKLECQGDGLELDKAVKVDHKAIVITLDILKIARTRKWIRVYYVKCKQSGDHILDRPSGMVITDPSSLSSDVVITSPYTIS